MTILINTEDNSAEEKTSKGPYEVETTQRERAGDGCVTDTGKLRHGYPMIQ